MAFPLKNKFRVRPAKAGRTLKFQKNTPLEAIFAETNRVYLQM